MLNSKPFVLRNQRDSFVMISISFRLTIFPSGGMGVNSYRRQHSLAGPEKYLSFILPLLLSIILLQVSVILLSYAFSFWSRPLRLKLLLPCRGGRALWFRGNVEQKSLLWLFMNKRCGFEPSLYHMNMPLYVTLSNNDYRLPALNAAAAA